MSVVGFGPMDVYLLHSFSESTLHEHRFQARLSDLARCPQAAVLLETENKANLEGIAWKRYVIRSPVRSIVLHLQD